MLLLLIIVGLLATIGIWVATWLLGLPIWIGVVVSIVSVLLVVGLVAFRRIRAVLRANSLERELLKQASQHADRANPQRRAEIIELQGSMKAAIDALKRTKLGAKGGTAALYALPWYVIVGPPAAGKTTALEQSGLAFSTPGSGGRPKIKGTAGTKNCDWWFSKEAILLDTAGRFAMEDDDHDEWVAFLDTIRRFRPERPLDGIVVALSAIELVNLGESQLEDLATKLRARVDEVMNRLQMVIPIYVMFTKADLIAGFVEFWGDLGKQQRGQPWGTTFALDDERLSSEPGRAFEAEFDLLVSALHARMIERLPRERVPDARARILQFPVEFRALRSPLVHFVEELCRTNPYQETPILRGFYFTSGTQVGRPVDLVLANMARGFDLRLGGLERPGTSQPVSYFVTDLFRGIVFPDRHIAVRSTSRVREYARRQIVGSVGVVLVTLVIVVPATMNYLRNVQLARDTKDDVEQVLKPESGPRGKDGANLGSLEVLHQRVVRLEKANAGFRIPGWLGDQAAAPLLEPTRGLYVQRLRDVIEGPVRDQVKKDVRAIADGYASDPRNFRTSYDSLKLYWMMTSPKELDADWAETKLAEKWGRTSSDANLDPEKLRGHTHYYVDAFSKGFPVDPKWAWTLDQPLLTRARDRLCQMPLEQLRYSSLISKAEGVAPIRPEEVIVGPAVQFIVPRARDVLVDGAYTLKGWELIRPALENPDEQLSIDPKVLGCASMQAPSDPSGSNSDALRDLYFKRYESAWSQFLAGLQVKAPSEVPPGDIQTAIDELAALADSDGPYKRLFRTVSDNARLDVGPSGLLDKGLDKAKALGTGALDKLTGKDAGAAERNVSPVEKHFRRLIRFWSGDSGAGGDGQNSGLQQYLDQLNKLSVVLRQLKESKAEPTAEVQQELARAKVFVEVLLGQLDAPTRQLLEPLLMNPIRGSGEPIRTSFGAYLGEKWKGEVWDLWNTKLAPRYPFADAREDVALPELVEFFRPATGTLWKFFEKNLADRIERKGNAFVLKPTPEPSTLRPELLGCLGVAQEITDAVFTSAEPNVAFQIRMQSAGASVSEITFKVDGQATTYKNEPEKWTQAQWPGKGTPHGAFLQVKGAGGLNDELPRNGDFGLFRLLAAGGIKPAAAEGILVANWNLNRPGVPAVTIEFKPTKSIHPFARNFFSRLRCPQEITQGPVAAAGVHSP